MQNSKSWLFPRVWAALSLLLIGVTYPLWFPVADESGYPLIALFDLGRPMALISTITLVVSLVGVTVVGDKSRRLWWFVACSLFLSFVVDQHRLQPWAYQTAIYAVVFATLPPRAARCWLIPFVASIYIYSAAGKLDYQFTHTVGQDFLSTAGQFLGGLPDVWDPSLRAKLALLFPIIELSAGVGLLFETTRKFVVPVVMLMHIALLAILGPWGLDHSGGVLVWNLALLAQAYWLLMVSAPESTEPNAQSRSVFAPIAYGLVLTAMLAPMGERSGYWDHWTSWALYSPHNSRADVEVHASAIDALPKSLAILVDQDASGDRWHSLNLGRWSLSVRKVPVYPQARYQLELADELARRYELMDAIRVRQRGVSDRWTGARDEHLWRGQREIEKALGQFWLSH